MLYQDPPTQRTTYGARPISLVAWGPWKNGTAVTFWNESAAEFTSGLLDTKGRATPADQQALKELTDRIDPAHMPRHPVPEHGYLYHRTTFLTFDPTEPHDADGPDALQRTITATWLLMGQRIVRDDRQPADRSTRRRVHRLNPGLATDVRLIELRRARTPDDQATAETPGTRAYQHRWVVRGHWRNHWYPTLQTHRPLWISPYIAGPPQAPLLGGERVHVVKH